MKKVYDCVVITGEYKNSKGETKKNYLTVGAVFESDKGMSMRLEALPTTGFNGWISFYQPKEKEQKVETYSGGLRKGAGQVNGGLAGMDDDIPFN